MYLKKKNVVKKIVDEKKNWDNKIISTPNLIFCFKKLVLNEARLYKCDMQCHLTAGCESSLRDAHCN